MDQSPSFMKTISTASQFVQSNNICTEQVVLLQYEAVFLLGVDDVDGPEGDLGIDDDELESRYFALRFSEYLTKFSYCKKLLRRIEVSYKLVNKKE